MTWRQVKNDGGYDNVWDEVELGIAPSPHKGTAMIQNANIATESGEVLANYGRTNQAQLAISGGTLTASVADGSTLLAADSTLKAGTWIKVTASTISSISATTGATTATVTYLAVGGGGSGGAAGSNGAGGGGGAGQVATSTAAMGVGTYAITVGSGGAGSTGGSANGTSSIIAGVVTAVGGGGGGNGIGASRNGSNGASGGGAGGDGGTAGTPGTGSAGNNGGNTSGSVNNMGGGGGGGAGAAGGNASSGATINGGAGGAGTASSISGSSVTYGGGGGGGAETVGGPVGGGVSGAGGSGGGGAGGAVGTTGASSGVAATANTGGGGGGAGNANQATVAGGNGGSGIVIVSYDVGSMIATGGTITIRGGKIIHTFTSSGVLNVTWVNPGGYYYVSYKNTSNKVKLSTKYDPTGANPQTHGTSGTATYDTVAVPGAGIAKAVEKYTTATTTEFRYYILDSNGRVWVYDTAIYDSSLAASGVGTTWMLPDPASYSSNALSGMAILNGWLMVISNAFIYSKPTCDLGLSLLPIPNVYLNEPFANHKNYALVGSQGKLYYCDGNYIGELFPTTSIVTSVANVQSYSQYSATTTSTSTISKIFSGSLPYEPGGTRIPVVFFTDVYGTLPTGVTSGTVYYIEYGPTLGTFVTYTAITGGSVVDLQTGASGNQFFNTFYPFGNDAGVDGTHTTALWSGQRVNLPTYETAQCLLELGNAVLIGCDGSAVYPWNQVDATPSDIVQLPERNVTAMVNANNTAYIFAGFKGNIYITNGSVASLALKVPDYAAGVPGSPLTYIDPYFTWKDAAYLRGRVYFSIMDETATKSGNCGGVWSFIPSQNLDPNQSTGMALRLDNQNSYGTYSGFASLILPNEEQDDSVTPKYFTAWQSTRDTGTATYGIDNSSGVPVTQYVVETDLLPTGTQLNKITYMQLEYKLASALAAGDSVAVYYRLNATDAWQTCGAPATEGNQLSGYFKQQFQKTQWVQFRIVATTSGNTSSSFVRLRNLMLR